jgi:hypothetical protein
VLDDDEEELEESDEEGGARGEGALAGGTTPTRWLLMAKSGRHQISSLAGVCVYT